MKVKYLVIISIIFFIGCKFNTNDKVPEKGFISWLPAPKWEDALLTGNGTMGALVMGNPFEETIILNHALLYLPNETPLVPPNMAKSLDQIRKLSLSGKWKEASELGVKVWEKAGYGSIKWTDPYVPAADLKISAPASNISKYERKVDFQTAEATVEWQDDSGYFTRKTFVSRADGVMITQIKGDNKVNASISIEKHPHEWSQNSFVNQLIHKSESKAINNQYLQYHCEYTKSHGLTPKGYNGIVRVVSKGGTTDSTGHFINVNNADEILIYTVIEPFYDLEIGKADSIMDILSKFEIDYNILLQRQIKTHGELYNKMNLNLFPTDDEKLMTSETLVLKARNKTSPGIIQRQFEAARYNILCATGTNPPNLQGIWSGTWTPPWSSDFTHDGNVEVAVSNFLNGNMTELLMAYFDYHERLLPYYRENAKQLYGLRGIQIPGHTSTHGYNNHYDKTWCLEYWNGGAGWTASYFYDYFLYTNDTAFLREHAFPFINEALQFWEDFLETGKDGNYMSVPSYSPENNPLEHNWQNCINATMDFAIIKQLINNWIESAGVLGIDSVLINQKKEMLSKIPPYQISNEGVIKEWMWPGFTDNQTHRHVSHLYGLYEIPDEDLLNTPEFKEAVFETIKKRMEIRKQYQGGEMAFGMCHIGFAAVNIGDTKTASEVLEYLSRFYWTNSMATTHNPGSLFNVDISGGFPSLITRMIVNSKPGEISLLPAIPDNWEKGEAKGILCRGNIEINKISWDNSMICVEITSKSDQIITIHLSENKDVKELIINEVKANKNSKSFTIDLKANQTNKILLNL